MAIPSFVGAGAGWVVTTGNANGTKTGVTVGNLIIVHILSDAYPDEPTVTTTNNSLENLAGTDNALTVVIDYAGVGTLTGTANHEAWAGRALATTVTVNVSTPGADMYCRIYEFAGAATGTTLASVIEDISGASLGSSNTIADQSVTTAGDDRLVVNLVAVNDDNAVGAFTGMSGGTWVEAVAEYATATGTDGCIQLQTADMASAGTINGGTYTMLASDGWGVIGFAIRPAVTTPAYAVHRALPRRALQAVNRAGSY